MHPIDRCLYEFGLGPTRSGRLAETVFKLAVGILQNEQEVLPNSQLLDLALPLVHILIERPQRLADY